MAKEKKAIGDSGISGFFSGVFTDEYLTALQGTNGSVIYDTMRKHDTQIGMMLRMIKNPILSCDWEFLPAGDDKQQITCADFCDTYFKQEAKMPFGLLLQQILTCVEFGFSVFEVVWGFMEYEGKTYHIPKLQIRLQKSIQQIDPDTHCIKQLKTKGQTVDIPFEDLVFFILSQEGEDMRGVSTLRNSYQLWKYKQQMLKVQAIGIERMAIGIPILTFPNMTSTSDNDFLQAREAIENFTAYQNMYIAHPDKFKFTIQEGKFDSEAVKKTIDGYDTSIAKSTLTQFIELGSGGSSGSYSLGADQSRLFIDGLQFMVDYIEQIFNKYVIKKMIDYNFGEQKENGYPELKGLNLNKNKIQQLIDNYQKLIQVNAIQGTIEDEKFIRKTINVRELTEEEIQERKDKADATEIKTGKEGEGNSGNIEPKKLAESKRLTPAEQKRVKFIKLESKRIEDYMTFNLLAIKDKLLRDIEKVLDTGTIEAKGLKNIKLSLVSKYKEGLARKIAYVADAGWKNARTIAKPHLEKKLAEEINPKDLPKELQVFAINEADAFVEDQTMKLRVKAILTAQKGADTGLSTGQIISDTDMAVDAYIEGSSLPSGADNLTTTSFNTAEMKYYGQATVSKKIQAYKFNALIDDKTTPLCRDLNGHYYKSGSSALAKVQTPLHWKCRSYLEVVWIDESKVKIDNYISPLLKT